MIRRCGFPSAAPSDRSTSRAIDIGNRASMLARLRKESFPSVGMVVADFTAGVSPTLASDSYARDSGSCLASTVEHEAAVGDARDRDARCPEFFSDVLG